MKHRPHVWSVEVEEGIWRVGGSDGGNRKAAHTKR
jgi:hypothetical protein